VDIVKGEWDMVDRRKWLLTVAVLLGVGAARSVALGFGQDPPKPADPAKAEVQEAAKPPTLEELTEKVAKMEEDAKAKLVDLDTLWVLLAAFLVFFMQAGFALVETGLTRAKNAVNICMKNLFDFSAASIVFWIAGFAIMFGKGNAFMGMSGFFLDEGGGPETFGSLSWSLVSTDCKFIFQLVFAGTASTIVSGAMAERTKFTSYMFYSALITLITYPISGHWIWGGGFLSVGGWFGEEKGFFDFAGSTVVHSVGGWMALVGAFFVGARSGKYGPDGKVNALPGHNFPMAMLGVFILWLGWFGFNPGSSMMAQGSGGLISHIAVTTNAAAAAGALAALVTAKLWFGKWDASMAGNGALAGLVAITAPCAFVTTSAATVIGLVGGVLVVASVVFVDRTLRIDDPVGAVSVHLTNGIWGTLALGLFSHPDYKIDGLQLGLFNGGGIDQLKIQLVGVLVVGAWCLLNGILIFGGIKALCGLRVKPEEEYKGLDIDEHGMEAYPNFQVRQ
jgi:Amt family ammonium transporter